MWKTRILWKIQWHEISDFRFWVYVAGTNGFHPSLLSFQILSSLFISLLSVQLCVCKFESLEAVKSSLSVESNKAQQWSEIALSNFNGVLLLETPYFTTRRPTVFPQISRRNRCHLAVGDFLKYFDRRKKLRTHFTVRFVTWRKVSMFY